MTLPHALSPEWITFGMNDFVLTGSWRRRMRCMDCLMPEAARNRYIESRLSQVPRGPRSRLLAIPGTSQVDGSQRQGRATDCGEAHDSSEKESVPNEGQRRLRQQDQPGA